MNKKRLFIQVAAAIVLYVVISLILEKEYTQPVIIREILEGVVFGLLYGVFVYFREKFKNKKE
ncbi:hypothetical protein R3X28_15680 [Maribacter sp. TH_r10]|uniref:Uncharacterized protein n=1 Tax=Maribacter luteus TaxID=2594478 RepID=A0A6I2MK36_9FLAO|nr:MULTISPECIES: hypothetical protein [Maribacter]MDV7140332.1 hypothetical protein [Maribacter sp. TH_r10]MRX63197.1 hypothetical protein [Maribacter luteus]